MGQERLDDEERPESRDLHVYEVPPPYSPRLGPTLFSEFAGDLNPKQTIKRWKRKRIQACNERRTAQTAIGVITILVFFCLVNWFMLSRLHEGRAWLRRGLSKNQNIKLVSAQNEERKFEKPKRKYNGTYGRMLSLAAQALAENKLEPKELWQEPREQASAWKPCADQRSWTPDDGKNGYIMVTANGGINQQRVAVCNIVVVARLLNAALVIPNFMLSDVWTDAR